MHDKRLLAASLQHLSIALVRLTEEQSVEGSLLTDSGASGANGSASAKPEKLPLGVKAFSDLEQRILNILADNNWHNAHEIAAKLRLASETGAIPSRLYNVLSNLADRNAIESGGQQGYRRKFTSPTDDASSAGS